MKTFANFAALGAILLSGGCRDEAARESGITDPMASAALSDPLLVDPDLNTRNPAGEGLYGAGPVDGSLPPLDVSPEAAASAREEAARILGGKSGKAPGPTDGRDPGPAFSLKVLAGRLAGTDSCPSPLTHSAIWAARLPGELSVYPRAHVLDSAGADSKDCALRIVRFATPVSAKDVIDFYFARLKSAGHAAHHARLDDGSVLTGGKAGLAWRIEARKGEGALADIVLISLARQAQ